MAIPDYQKIMLPLLRFAGDGREHSSQDAVEFLADQFKLTEEDRRDFFSERRIPRFAARVGWARSYLKKAGLLEVSRRGDLRITPRGLDVLKNSPPEINLSFVKQLVKSGEPPPESEESPEEQLERAYQKLRENLAGEILQAVKGCSPVFFERLVVDVLVGMGYGGTQQDAGKAVGRSGDNGVDGIIKEDRLGLDRIYIQAKRWDGVVGRPEIQKFAGALAGHKARKGVFITTSNFSKEAVDYAANIETRIVLIDGETFAQLMIDHNVGASLVASYDIKKIDLDYFSEP